MTEQVFVARERELAQLHAFVDRALAGHGQVCFVTGEAGAGKTALVTEFARRAQAQHADLLVAVGQGDAQTGAGDPYLPFREVLGQLTGDVEAKLAQGTITQENASRLRGFLRISGQALLEYGPDLIDIFVPGAGLATRAGTFLAGKAGWLDRLESLTNRKTATLADTGPSAGSGRGLDQSRIFEQYTNVLKALAAERPLIVVVDDLQWADAASINLLFRLGRQIQDSRILILGTYRPADVALGRDGQQHPLEDVVSEFKRYFGDIWVSLAQTDEAQGRRFVDALLDAEPNRLDEDFRQALFRHTRGHPLFTTELLRDMQERGDLVYDEQGRWIQGPALDWETLPARVEGVIEKRIHRLSEELREALIVASVEGEDFTAQVIAGVQATSERQLVRQLTRELDKQHRLVQEQGVERVGRRRLSLYRFRHNLFQRYLYNNLGESERAFLHEDVGNVLEELYGEQADEIAVQLARHFVEAGLDNKALGYLIQAGDAAYRQYANTEAVAHYTRALEIAGHGEADSEQLIHLYRNRGRALELDDHFEPALSNYQEMEALARQRGDRAMALAALLAQTTIRTIGTPVHDPEQARTLAEQALALARELGDLAAEAKALWNLALVCLHSVGDPHQAVAYGEKSLAIARELNLREQMAFTLNDLVYAYVRAGQRAQAEAAQEEATRLWRELGNLPMLAGRLNYSGSLAYLRGDLNGALAATEEAYQISQSIGNVWNQLSYSFMQGLVRLESGTAGEAIAPLEGALRLSQQAAAFQPILHVTLGLNYSALGALEQGLAHYQQARAEAGGAVSAFFRPPLLAALARLAICHGELTQAEAAIRDSGIELKDGIATDEALVVSLPEGQLALARQEYARTVSLMDELIAAMHDAGARVYLPEALYLRGQALLAQGHIDTAQAALAEARAEAEAMGARRMLWQILAALAEIESRRGHVAEAENLRAQAREVIAFIADHAGTPDLRTSFLNLPDVRAVLEDSTG
jgi:tetratricopeptide (TPR) repeat protein